MAGNNRICSPAPARLCRHVLAAALCARGEPDAEWTTQRASDGSDTHGVLLCGVWKVCLYWGWKSIPTFDNTESYISSAIYTSITIIILGSRIRAILHFNYTV